MKLVLTTNCAGDMRVQCLRDAPRMRHIEGAVPPLLVCSSELQELTTPRKRGYRAGFGRISERNRLTAYGRTMIREAGAVLDEGPRTNCIFLTGTLPGSSDEALAALAAWSGWAVQTVKQWILDTVPNALYFGVWEYQKRGALHLHLCVRVENAVQARILKERWKARWIRVLDSISQRSQVDLYERGDGQTWASSKWIVRTDAQTVEKSVGNYLAKYLSKGSAKARRRCEFPPSAWYFVRNTLRTRIRELRRRLEVSLLSLPCAIDLYQAVSGMVAAQVSKAYAYLGKYDPQVKGLIALMRPVQAGAVWRDVTVVLRCLGATGDDAKSARRSPMSVAYAVFGGLVISHVDDS